MTRPDALTLASSLRSFRPLCTCTRATFRVRFISLVVIGHPEAPKSPGQGQGKGRPGRDPQEAKKAHPAFGQLFLLTAACDHRAYLCRIENWRLLVVLDVVAWKETFMLRTHAL